MKHHAGLLCGSYIRQSAKPEAAGQLFEAEIDNGGGQERAVRDYGSHQGNAGQPARLRGS